MERGRPTSCRSPRRSRASSPLASTGSPAPRRRLLQEARSSARCSGRARSGSGRPGRPHDAPRASSARDSCAGSDARHWRARASSPSRTRSSATSRTPDPASGSGAEAPGRRRVDRDARSPRGPRRDARVPLETALELTARGGSRRPRPRVERPRGAAHCGRAGIRPQQPSRPPRATSRMRWGSRRALTTARPLAVREGTGASSGYADDGREAALEEAEKRSSRPVSRSRPSRPSVSCPGALVPRETRRVPRGSRSCNGACLCDGRLGGEGAGDRVLGPVHLARRRRRRRAAHGRGGAPPCRAPGASRAAGTCAHHHRHRTSERRR